MTDPVQTYSIYRITCRETGKAYVGATRKRPEKRRREHAEAASRGATYPTMKGAVEALGLRGYGELYRLLSDTDSGVSLTEKNQ